MVIKPLFVGLVLAIGLLPVRAQQANTGAGLDAPAGFAYPAVNDSLSDRVDRQATLIKDLAEAQKALEIEQFSSKVESVLGKGYSKPAAPRVPANIISILGEPPAAGQAQGDTPPPPNAAALPQPKPSNATTVIPFRQVVPKDMPLGLLAIYGPASGLTAEYHTGKGEIVRLKKGASLSGWQVVEVRKTGLVIDRAGEAQVIPLGAALP